MVVTKADRDAGNYWHLPDGEKQNTCPRRFLKEDPEFWQDILSTYNAYEKGFLPGRGGTDDQPALFLPIMATISSALQAEDEYERSERDRLKGMAGNGKQNSGHANLMPKRK